MKFLIQIPQLIFGGAEKVLVSFANELVRNGHEVHILETYEKGYLKPQFDPRVTFDAICSKTYEEKYYASVAQVKKNPLLLVKLLFSKLVGYRRFAEKLAARRYAGREFDAAINYLEIDTPAFLLRHIHADKYIQWYHTDAGDPRNHAEADALLPWMEKMDAVVCVSGYAKQNLVSRYPSIASKTHLIYNFFEADEICKMAQVPVRFDAPSPVLLSVGRMTEAKQYPRFLDVLARLKAEGYPFSWHVLGDGIQRPQIEEKIRQLQLQDRVFLHGLTDNPYKYMKACDLFVLPSGYEGFPTVTVEAKILGCPVLATDVSGIREQLRHGETGWIVDNNEDAIFTGLKYVLSHADILPQLCSSDGIDHICSSEEKLAAFFALFD